MACFAFVLAPGLRAWLRPMCKVIRAGATNGYQIVQESAGNIFPPACNQTRIGYE